MNAATSTTDFVSRLQRMVRRIKAMIGYRGTMDTDDLVDGCPWPSWRPMAGGSRRCRRRARAISRRPCVTRSSMRWRRRRAAPRGRRRRRSTASICRRAMTWRRWSILHLMRRWLEHEAHAARGGRRRGAGGRAVRSGAVRAGPAGDGARGGGRSARSQLRWGLGSRPSTRITRSASPTSRCAPSWPAGAAREGARAVARSAARRPAGRGRRAARAARRHARDARDGVGRARRRRGARRADRPAPAPRRRALSAHRDAVGRGATAEVFLARAGSCSARSR